MTRDEIFENRQEIAKRLLTSLREGGRLGKASYFTTTPYYDGEKKYRFSGANYLRLAAMSYHYGDLHDPRWYTKEDISRNGWTLKDYAHPEKLEIWGKSPDGSKTCELVDFYHVTDIPDKKILPDKEISLKDCLTDLQARNILEVSEHISLLDGLNAVQRYSRANGANELAAVMASQMWLTESGVRANFHVQQGLYSEELLNAAEKHPEILFPAAHQAQDVLYKLRRVPKRELSPVKDGAFSDLQVCFYWCDTHIKDRNGNDYPMDSIFTGKAAYEFLVQYNALDKHSFDEKFLGNHGYHKSEIELRYKDYDHGEMRIDLGDLELGDRTSIADALIYRLDMYRQNLLQDPDAAKRHWTENQRDGRNEGTYEDFLETVKKESAEFHDIMEEFRKEETSYLEEHPELAAINHEKANAFLYAIRAEDFPKLSYGMVNEKISDEIQTGHLLKENNFAVQDYIATYPGISMPYQNSKERTAQANLGRDRVVTFSSNWHPSDMAERLRRNKIPPVWLSVPPKEQELLQQLDGFRLEISREAPCGIYGGKCTLDYNGFSALRKLNEELETEDREARTAIEQRFSLRGEHVELSLYYNSEAPLFHAAYESGKQELFAIINEKNGILPEHLQEPVATICKYLPYDSRPTGLLQKRHTIGDNFPTMEESRENYIKDCKADLNMKEFYQVANYYSIVTLLNAEVNSAEDFSRRMVEEMVKDGITQNRMMRIIEKSQVHAEMREKIKQIAQSPETKSALRKVRVQANVAAENDKTTDAR